MKYCHVIKYCFVQGLLWLRHMPDRPVSPHTYYNDDDDEGEGQFAEPLRDRAKDLKDNIFTPPAQVHLQIFEVLL